MALEGLDQADWRTFSDAYGSAANVPALIRAFISDVPADRDFASELLFQFLWHQGNVFSATAAAVSFLYNLLEDEGPYDKRIVCDLIASIADALPPFFHCAGDPDQCSFWEKILRGQGRSLDHEIVEARRTLTEIRRQLARRPELLGDCYGGRLPDWLI